MRKFLYKFNNLKKIRHVNLDKLWKGKVVSKSQAGQLPKLVVTEYLPIPTNILILTHYTVDEANKY